MLFLLVVAGLGLAYLAGVEEGVVPAGPASLPTLPRAIETAQDSLPELQLPTTPVDSASPSTPGASSTGAPGRIEVGEDGSITITNIPDDPSAARLERTPDGGLLITNQP